MSRDISVVGFREPDELWNKMKKVWDACHASEVEVPQEVVDFFDDTEPVDAPGKEIPIEEAMKEWSTDWATGYEIDVSKLPKGLKIIRAYMS